MSADDVGQAAAQHGAVAFGQRGGEIMAIYAHTNLDAMRQALDAIEWEDL